MPLARLHELADKVDAFFDRVHSAHRDRMQCSSGCSDCCQRFSVTLVEAAAVARGLAEVDPDARAAMAARAATDSPRCAALDDAGRCAIYPWRPIICRSHGAPIRRTERSLPVVDVCPRNFTAGTEDVPDADVFDQTTLSTVLGAIDAAFADAAGADRGSRIDLADLLAAPDHYFAID